MIIILVILMLAAVMQLIPTIKINYKVLQKSSLKINIGLWCTGLFLMLFSAVRHYSIGVDTKSYVLDFYEKKNMTWSYIFQKYTEPLYNGLVKLISEYTDSYTVYLLIIAILFMLSITIFIKNYSKNYFISFLSFVALGYFYFSMAGLRQTVAIAILLFSYKYVRERRLIPFLICVAFAAGFHNSAVIFLIIYPIANWALSWKHWAIIAAGYMFSGILVSNFFSILFSLTTDRFSGYQEYTSEVSLSGYIIQICIFVFCSYYYKKSTSKCSEDRSLYNLMMVGIVFQGFTPYLGEFFRLSMYFSIYSIIAIPNACASETNKHTKLIVMLGVISVLLAYFILFSGKDTSIIPYRFYWQ